MFSSTIILAFPLPHQTITALRESCERHETMEQDYTSLEVEYSRVTKMLANMKETVAKVRRDTLTHGERDKSCE